MSTMVKPLCSQLEMVIFNAECVAMRAIPTTRGETRIHMETMQLRHFLPQKENILDVHHAICFVVNPGTKDDTQGSRRAQHDAHRDQTQRSRSDRFDPQGSPRGYQLSRPPFTGRRREQQSRRSDATEDAGPSDTDDNTRARRTSDRVSQVVIPDSFRKQHPGLSNSELRHKLSLESGAGRHRTSEDKMVRSKNPEKVRTEASIKARGNKRAIGNQRQGYRICMCLSWTQHRPGCPMDRDSRSPIEEVPHGYGNMEMAVVNPEIPRSTTPPISSLKTTCPRSHMKTLR